MHRNADRAALVGHRAGDRLPNPPGGISAELEAAAVFELVHRPHQAGIAFLDEVEERQPAVAVFLGDRDDEPQVAFRQSPLRLLVAGVDLADLVHPPLEAAGRFLAGLENGTVFLDELLPTSRRLLRPAVGLDLAAQFLQPRDEVVERGDHGFDPLGPQAQLLDQTHAPATAVAQTPPCLASLRHLSLLRERDPIVGAVLPQQHLERPQVVRQPAEDLLLLESIGDRHLHRAVEGKLAAVHAGEHLE